MEACSIEDWVQINAFVTQASYSVAKVWGALRGALEDSDLLAEWVKVRGEGISRDVRPMPLDRVEAVLRRLDGKIQHFYGNSRANVRGVISYHFTISAVSGFSITFRHGLRLRRWESLISRLAETLEFTNAATRYSAYAALLHPKWNRARGNVWTVPSFVKSRLDYGLMVSEQMWLGEAFWKFAACRKEDVTACDWLKCEEHPGFLKVTAWPEPFSSAEGEQGEIQHRLLTLLYGVTGDPE